MSTAIRYRADIDGMRAVAVLLVLLFHAGVPWMSGGFVGVDVFFVLTGFLITSILLKQANEGRLSLREFYLRRIRRLLPALVVVVVATLIAGWFILLPGDLLALLDSARYALASAGNLYFWLNTGGYFDADIHELPLLHTWSLGVEEQFYLLWPGLLLLAHKRLSPRALGGCIAILAVLLTGLSEVGARLWPETTYFLLHGRAFEILLGAGLALGAPRVPESWRRGRAPLALVGLALMIAPALVLDGQSSFPGLNALWPCLGTGLLLLTGRGEGCLVNRALGAKPLVVIGLLSYAIYLWHWPIIAFAHYMGIELKGWVQLGVIVAPLALAGLSYLVVERPFRYRIQLGLLTSLSLLFVLPLVLVFAAHAAGKRLLPDDKPTAAEGKCAYKPDASLFRYCVLGSRKKKIDGIYVGDSYGGMYTKFADVIARDAGLSLRYSWFKITPPVPGVSAGRKPRHHLAAYNNERMDLVDDYEYAFFATSWSGYRYPPGNPRRLWNEKGEDVSAASDDLQMAVIDDLVQKGVKVVLIDRPPAPPGRKGIRKIRKMRAKRGDLNKHRVPKVVRGPDYFIERVRRKHPSVVIVQPFDALCDDEDCPVLVDGIFVYRNDGSHLTHTAAKALGERYLRELGNPLK